MIGTEQARTLARIARPKGFVSLAVVAASLAARATVSAQDGAMCMPSRASGHDAIRVLLDDALLRAPGEALCAFAGDAPPQLACMPVGAIGAGASDYVASDYVASDYVASDYVASSRARAAFEALAAHRAAGRVEDALVSLASLRALVPELADRWDLVEGELLPEQRRGCEAFARATESPLSAIAARGRVGRVRCLLATDDRRGAEELHALLARYPQLPEARALRLLQAAGAERRGETARAVAIYREIDLVHPETIEAAQARARLEALAAAGVRVPALTTLQKVERCERLVVNGPPELAREEVERLRAMRLPPELAARVALLAARVARAEGRFEDAARLALEARGIAARDPSVPTRPIEDALAAAVAREQTEARANLRRLANGIRALRRVPTTRLFAYLRTAARAGLRRELDAALDEVAARQLPCGLALQAGVIASGSGDDLRIARVLERCVEAPGSIGTASRYHRARALERAGRMAEARAELEQVIAQDGSDTRWYALWAGARLAALPDARSAGADPQQPLAATTLARDGSAQAPSGPEPSSGPLDATVVAPIEPSAESFGPPTLAPLEEGKIGDSPRALGPVPASPGPPPTPAPEPPARPAAPERELPDALDVAPPPWQPLPGEQIEAHLADLADRHGDAFPWLRRALALWRLGDVAGCTDELHEAFLAWHEALGRPVLRAGLEAVYRGATPARIRVSSIETWRARRALTMQDRRRLAEVAASLGEHGLAVRFEGAGRAAMRPRAYEAIVNEVARERGLDPNLLFAVMRVESVYNPRIVSYAGAIGLMQIMPRTGRLVARAMGRENGFGVDDLLDPRTNIEMGAWYLASLIRRFQGRVVLAIAAYNGGPHNVRRWMREHGENMPIDALCERIPFEQTHRYVRRVLGHWAAYRAQQGLPPIELDPEPPRLDVDRVAF